MLYTKHSAHTCNASAPPVHAAGNYRSLRRAGWRLLLLDASKGWTVAEEIAIQVGRRHFRAASLSELQENLATWAPRPGDRAA